MKGDVVLLPPEVARNLEVLFGVGRDRCRLCVKFDPMYHDGARGLCERTRRYVGDGDTCNRFEPR
jgi:hypothetical protein